ncbi:hypothetical protein D3C76_524870 [compost metagenome]
MKNPALAGFFMPDGWLAFATRCEDGLWVGGLWERPCVAMGREAAPNTSRTIYLKDRVA